MPRVELLDPRESDDPELREFASTVARPDGSIGAHFAAEAHFPEVLMNVYDARLAIARRGDLGPELFARLAVAVSMANDCPYCVGAYATQLSARLGGDRAVREFQRALRAGELTGREGDVVGFALGLLADPHGVTDGDFQRLRSERGFTDRTFVEVIYAVNIVSGYNRLTVALELEYDHDYPEEWAALGIDPDA